MKTIFKKSLSLFLCFVLITAIALVSGCNDNKETPQNNNSSVVESNDITSSVTEESKGDVTVKGEGKTKFNFDVTDKDGNVTSFEIRTDKTIVGEALQELGLIEGDEGDFGLYVKKVNGIVADFDIDGTYWAFYVNGAYATSGVDTTEIKDGESYAFKVEK
ncbi:MAG: DUF4430 domain-containing protein [Ruminococcaceae bacterium]|nr:DUF4430 domain-containing protein [Oscillospiraceae bacterium]